LSIQSQEKNGSNLKHPHLSNLNLSDSPVQTELKD
jgi:hypothetical protein